MKTDMIIDQKTQKVKLILDWSAGKVGQHLTADEAEKVIRLIASDGVQAIPRQGLADWQRSGRGGVQKHRETTNVPQRNAMEHPRRTNHPRTPRHRQIQPMAKLLECLQKT